MQTPPAPLETSLFAHEIETAIVAAAFQVPERIALIYRELDPSVHFTIPALRQILAAIGLMFSQLGSTDFADLIQVLREFDQLEGCGGIDGVNTILSACPYGFSSQDAADAIIAHYIQMLKAYALARLNATPVYRFNRGDITLARNFVHSGASSPQWIGKGHVAGRAYRAMGFKCQNANTQPILNISLCPL